MPGKTTANNLHGHENKHELLLDDLGGFHFNVKTDSLLEFVNKYGVGTCASSVCDGVRGVNTFDSLDNAIGFANGSSSRVFVDGVATGRGAFIYRSATMASGYTIQSGPMAGTASSLSGVGNVIQTIAHETGHLRGYQHRTFQMQFRETKALQHFQRSR